MHGVKNPRAGTGVSSVLVAGPTPPSSINKTTLKISETNESLWEVKGWGGGGGVIYVILTVAPFLR